MASWICYRLGDESGFSSKGLDSTSGEEESKTVSP